MAAVCLSLTGEVGDDMFKKVFTLYKSISVDQSIRPSHVDLYLNTEGGDVYQALGIYDLLIQIKEYVEVNITCVGQVMSSGIIILQAASYRLATKNVQLMTHYGECSSESLNELNHNKHLITLANDIMYDRLLVSKKTLKNWCNGNHYFTAERALELGLIDEVI